MRSKHTFALATLVLTVAGLLAVAMAQETPAVTQGGEKTATCPATGDCATCPVAKKAGGPCASCRAAKGTHSAKDAESCHCPGHAGKHGKGRMHGARHMAAKAADDASTVTYQQNCPVMGGPIDKKHYADHEGQRVYFCCPSCKTSFRKNPEEHLGKIRARGHQPYKVQTTCPVMGGKVNEDLHVDHQGERLYVCCGACIAEVEKRPGHYMQKLGKQGVALDPVPESGDEKQDDAG